MSETRLWTEHEDLILKRLREEQKIQKWTAIAQIMADDYNFKGRNGKQCKERYQLISDENLDEVEWDFEQEQKLFQLHNQLGNKWAIIGQQLMNKEFFNDPRSDNEVKNHLYSKLRKALRKLNKTIKEHFKKEFKEIKQNLIYKIIEGAEDKFKNTPLLDLEVSEYCTELKMKILNYSYDDIGINPLHDFENNREDIRYFLEELTEFSKDYKRKPKKCRRASGHNFESLAIENMNVLTIPREEKKIRSNGNSPCHSEVSEEDSEEMAEFNHFPLKIPNEIFGIKLSGKSNIPTAIEKKENIILQLPTNLKMLNNEMQEENENHNGSVGYSNVIPGSKNSLPESTWNEKGSDSIWGSGKNDSPWKGTSSSEMIDEGFLVESELKRVGLLEEDEDVQSNVFQNNMKKLNVLKRSSFSNFEIEEGLEHMLCDDSSYHPRIRMTGVEGKKFWILDSSSERSDKLFKSNEAYGMFESVDSKRSDKLFESAEKE